MTLKTSFSIKSRWYRKLQELKMDGAELIILCNKIDVIKDSELNDVKIRTFVDQAETFASENNISLFHTSALTGKNIHTVFNQMILCILSNHALLQTITERAKDATETQVIAFSDDEISLVEQGERRQHQESPK
ncbi:unnamed protein product, partial [Didymodactylos carnosus]